MDFSEAFALLKAGKKLRRKVWNDKFYITVNEIKLTETTYIGYIEMHYETFTSQWVPSNGDLFAKDWDVIE